MLDYRLNVFKSVAQNMSFTKAANELFITQPAVTKHIKELESGFEVKLFNRVGNKITLTPAGKTLLSYTEHILLLHNELRFELSQYKAQREGKLHLGASTTIAQYVIPSALAKFHHKYPEIKLSLINGNTEFIEQQLLTNNIDLGIVEGIPTHQDIKYFQFLNDELLIFTSEKNRKIPSSVTFNELVKLPLVLRERGSGTLEVIEKSLYAHQINPKQLNVIMYLGSTEAIKTYIKNGEGVGIVSRYAIENEIENGTFRAIHSPVVFNRQFNFILPQGAEPGGLIKLFLNFIQKADNF